MKIKIIQIGKNKDAYISDGIDEFLKRLKKFAQVGIVTLKEATVSKTFSKEKAVQKEGEEISKEISKKNSNDFLIVLDEKGSQYGSVEFSKIIGRNKNIGKNLIFIIGGPFGLSPEIKKHADLILSFSFMTFTHQMIRLILLEQIYRAFTIILGQEYHH